MSYSQLTFGEIMEGLLVVVLTIIASSLFAIIVGSINSRPALYQDED